MVPRSLFPQTLHSANVFTEKCHNGSSVREITGMSASLLSCIMHWHECNPHQHQSPFDNPGDPHEPWQSFLSEVYRGCGKNPHCWYSSIIAVDGPISINCGMKNIGPSSVSSFLSSASVIYTSRFSFVSPSQPSQSLSASSSPPSLPSSVDLASPLAPIQSSTTYSMLSSSSGYITASAGVDSTDNHVSPPAGTFQVAAAQDRECQLCKGRS